MTLDLAQKTTGLLRQILPEALWTAGTILLSSPPFMGADPFLIYSCQFILSAHVLSEICRGGSYHHVDKILEKQSRIHLYLGVSEKPTKSRPNFKAMLS